MDNHIYPSILVYTFKLYFLKLEHMGGINFVWAIALQTIHLYNHIHHFHVRIFFNKMLNMVDVLRWFCGDLNLDLQGLTIQSMAPISGNKDMCDLP